MSMPRQANAAIQTGLGFNLVAWDGDINRNPKRWVRAIQEIREFGVRRVTIVPYWFVDPARAQIYERSRRGQDIGPTSETVSAAMQAGHELGMEISLKPMIEIDTGDELGDVWRGILKIRPAQLEAFFEAYGNYIHRMAELAAANHADRFYVGSELASLTEGEATLPHWTALIGQLRELFPGGDRRLTYAANYDEFQQVKFWDQLDEICIDAYFKLGSRAEARGIGYPGTELMVSRWRKRFLQLKKFSKRHDRKIVFSEFGLIPYEFASTEPWNWHPQENADDDTPVGLDPREQQHGIESLLVAMQGEENWLSAVDFWHWQVPGSEGSLYNINARNGVGELIRQYANGH